MTCYKKKELQREVTERRIVSIQESGFFAPSRDIYLDKQTKKPRDWLKKKRFAENNKKEGSEDSKTIGPCSTTPKVLMR